MTEKPTLRRIPVDDLPGMLAQFDDSQRDKLALIGPGITLSERPEAWPEKLQGHAVFQVVLGRRSRMPREILQLQRLKSLTLWSLDLKDEDATAIAEHLGQLVALDLSMNELTDVGVQALCKRLGQLRCLDLGNFVEPSPWSLMCSHHGNRISDAGVEAIAHHLTLLTSLDLSGVAEINFRSDAVRRAFAENLPQLTYLNLSGNNINDGDILILAEHLGQITSLDLGENMVGPAGARAISQHLGHLTSLNLRYNQLGDAGARTIAEHLDHLVSLDMRANGVGNVGSRVIAEHLKKLTSLDLNSNKISDAGARAIAGNLGRLTSLGLGHNRVGDPGARAIAEHLRNLTSLNLGANSLGEETVLAIGEHLNDLRSLDLSSNQELNTIAPLAHLNLFILNVAKTGVTDLSPLKSMVLSGLPISLADIPWAGPGIYAGGCPLTHPSPELIQQGPESVLNYFREIESQGADWLFEAKLLLVGEGGAGKTSLLRRMFRPEVGLPSEDETTRGIDIHRHDFPIPNGRTFGLNVWDFGGQQIYHATHQFFLTKRSLYVLVDDTRSDHWSIHDEGFKFWLEVVETLSERSPLLIFQNEKGGRSKQIDEAGIKGRFPNVAEIHRGNLEDPNAAQSLLQAVEYFAQGLKHIGMVVPAKWVKIRQDLEELAKNKPYISLDDYFALYDRHLKPDRDKAMFLSHYLHDLGVFLHFEHPRELRRTVFLQNQWVTEAVFRILDDEQVKANRGRFTLADCDRLWSNHDYAEKEIELRALMVRFELCYRLPDVDQETWLVPQHLSVSKPTELNEWGHPGDLVLTYRYEFLPRGMVSRLIVRMHRFVQQPDLCWSRGALFEHDGTQVLVETTVRGNEIVIRSRGPERQALLSVIASDLDTLNDSFKGIRGKIAKWVPCICPTCAGLKEPALFDQKQLIDRKARGKGTIECPNPPDYADVSVLELLDGMNLEQWLERARKELPQDDTPTTSVNSESSEAQGGMAVKTVQIFLASSSELREDRDAFELYFRQQNDRLRKQGVYLEIVRWENFLDAMSDTRLQDEYNEAIRKCDIFVSLFRTKTGPYTKEEFEVAHKTFKETQKPLIYTYFQKATVSTSASYREDLISLWDFQKKLKELGHFYTEYESIHDLQKQFRDQLDKLVAGDLL